MSETVRHATRQTRNQLSASNAQCAFRMPMHMPDCPGDRLASLAWVYGRQREPFEFKSTSRRPPVKQPCEARSAKTHTFP